MKDNIVHVQTIESDTLSINKKGIRGGVNFTIEDSNIMVCEFDTIFCSYKIKITNEEYNNFSRALND